MRTAERLVEAGQYAFVEGRTKLRQLEEMEQKILRRAIAYAREKLMDDAMIDNRGGVIYWNAGDPDGRHIPGTVRS